MYVYVCMFNQAIVQSRDTRFNVCTCMHQIEDFQNVNCFGISEEEVAQCRNNVRVPTNQEMHERSGEGFSHRDSE